MTAELRNRAYAHTDDILVHRFDHPRISIYVRDEERAAYAETHDALPCPFGGGLRYGTDDRPATKGQTRFIIGVCTVCTVIFGALVVAVWLWSKGDIRWR